MVHPDDAPGWTLPGMTTFRSLRRLDIPWYERNPPSLVHLLRLCPALTELAIDLYEGWNNIPDVVRVFEAAPASLYRLELRGSARDIDYLALFDGLHVLPHLTSLRIDVQGVEGYYQRLPKGLIELDRELDDGDAIAMLALVGARWHQLRRLNIHGAYNSLPQAITSAIMVRFCILAASDGGSRSQQTVCEVKGIVFTVDGKARDAPLL